MDPARCSRARSRGSPRSRLARWALRWRSGPNPVALTVSPDTTRLLAAYGGKAPVQGGVAVLAVMDDDCRAHLTAPDHCPECEPGDELVLGTVVAYHWNSALVDAVLDHGPRRRSLASTAALQAALLCVMDHSVGGVPGPKGEPGSDGAPGTPGKDGAPGAPGTDGATRQGWRAGCLAGARPAAHRRHQLAPWRHDQT